MKNVSLIYENYKQKNIIKYDEEEDIKNNNYNYKGYNIGSNQNYKNLKYKETVSNYSNHTINYNHDNINNNNSNESYKQQNIDNSNKILFTSDLWNKFQAKSRK